MTAASEWWRTFFAGAPVEMWLQAVTDEQTRSEADFLEKALQVSQGGRILDVPCGGGRHAIELAARGYRVTGVDISDEFLAHAGRKGAERQAAVTWEHREMRDLPWPDQFDGAYCCGNSFGYLDDAGNAEFLKAVARVLRPGVRFVLETGACAESILPTLQERAWYPIGGYLFLAHRQYEPATGRMNMEYTFIRDGKAETREASQAVYAYHELCRLLQEAGFRDMQSYASVDQEPYRLGSRQLFLVATRVS